MTHFFIRCLETIFFTGLVGSLAVAILAFIGDCQEFFENDHADASSQAIGD